MSNEASLYSSSSSIDTLGPARHRSKQACFDGSSVSDDLLWVVSVCSDDILRMCELLQRTEVLATHESARRRASRIKRRAQRLQTKSRALLCEDLTLGRTSMPAGQRAVARSGVRSLGCTRCLPEEVLEMGIVDAPQFERLQQHLMDIRMELVALQSWKIEMSDGIHHTGDPME
ncbi:hypothetical protein FVE85_0364 [Porphyridium purpureum]|uniref:Uncharacterized protein n=1 Tax=Porphyridium purpureum TaxID=35688 RepID=A0A5J4YZQ1_PORPP|nr:hypothetical protein FVE85_0364 [Porphyridium purpureum]|eukprot:POR2176..scf208_2